jgi:hypothetical protein
MAADSEGPPEHNGTPINSVEDKFNGIVSALLEEAGRDSVRVGRLHEQYETGNKVFLKSLLVVSPLVLEVRYADGDLTWLHTTGKLDTEDTGVCLAAKGGGLVLIRGTVYTDPFVNLENDQLNSEIQEYYSYDNMEPEPPYRLNNAAILMAKGIIGQFGNIVYSKVYPAKEYNRLVTSGVLVSHSEDFGFVVKHPDYRGTGEFVVASRTYLTRNKVDTISFTGPTLHA